MAEIKKLYRSREDRMIFGLCGGLGRYFEIDSNLVRVIFVLISIAGGAGIIAYVLMSLIVPLAPGGENVAFKDEAREAYFIIGGDYNAVNFFEYIFSGRKRRYRFL